jgi:hypothetical protein
MGRLPGGPVTISVAGGLAWKSDRLINYLGDR